MSTTRTHQCNLCHDMIDNDSGRGVYFSSQSGGHMILFKHVRDVEHHLCNRCIYEIARNVKEGNA